MRIRDLALVIVLLATAACEDNAATQTTAFSLGFTAVAGDGHVGCATPMTGIGPGGTYSVGPSDLRFYVGNLRFWDAAGAEVPLELDTNEFQYRGVTLVDLTSNTDGSCAGNAIAFAEGTARTHDAITGKTRVGDVAAISFDVGVPQLLMKETIAGHSAEGAPSPLNEMYWSWASGYRHFVFNFTVKNGAGETGDGYVHVGSRDCGPADGQALEDRATCGFVNNPAVSIPDFRFATDKVSIDLAKLLAGVDFVSPIYDMTTFEVIGEGPGVECHSSPAQPDCAALFANFGVDLASGQSTAASDTVFGIHRHAPH